MKKIKITFLLLTTLFLSISCFGQTASVFVDIGVAGDLTSDRLCLTGDTGDEDLNGYYDCTFPTGFVYGPYSFTDPIPPGNKITNIEVVLYNVSCSTTFDLDIGGGMILGVISDASCDDSPLPCPREERISSEFNCNTDFGYNYGGENQFDAMSDGSGDRAICLSHVELIFTYAPCPSIPTLSQWGIIALSMIMLILGLVGLKQRKVIFG